MEDKMMASPKGDQLDDGTKITAANTRSATAPQTSHCNWTMVPPFGRLFALAPLLLVSLLPLVFPGHRPVWGHELKSLELFETITFKDENGVQFEEYAFRPPLEGLPTRLLGMYCASIKMRLYWNVFRLEVKETRRKGFYLRRLARLARHLFNEELRTVDKPFNATMLKRPDDYFAASLVFGDEEKEASAVDRALQKVQSSPEERASSTGEQHQTSGTASKLMDSITGKISKQISIGKNGNSNEIAKADLLEDNEELQRIEQELQTEGAGAPEVRKRLKDLLKHWAPKLKNVGHSVYTRWRTIWWLMMPCLFAKYYLWDPALDEFKKLQRSLVMWPQFQVAKMHELDCGPLKLFKRILDTCKLLNPLMHLNFGQFSLEKLTRFKGQQ